MAGWFRAYSEALNDPKIQKLSLEAFKAWHNALYLAAQNDSRDGNIGTLDDVSFAFRETKSSVSSAFHQLLQVGLIETVGETFRIKSWSKRQYKSDTSTDRVKRFRERSKIVTETAPDTEQIRTDTDTDTDIKKTYPSDSQKKVERTIKKKIPVDCPTPEDREKAVAYWRDKGRDDLSPDEQAEKFRAYHTSYGNRMQDWSAAWKTWYVNAVDFNRPSARGSPDAIAQALDPNRKSFWDQYDTP